MRGPTAENITNRMSSMRVGSDADGDNTLRATGDESSGFHCEDEADDEEELEIRPLGVRGRGRGGCECQQNRGSRRGRISKAPAGDKGGKHPTWSVEEMLKLAQVKRDQQAHFDGMPHNYGPIRNREWKLQDLQKRLVENASWGKNFFNLTPALRTKEGFNFRMDERMYLDNLADTSARGEVQMSGDTQRPSSVEGESVAGGDAGDGNDEDGGSARESGFSARSTGNAGKRKNMRQRTFDIIAEVMEKHGALMADTVEKESNRQCSILEWQCDILEHEVDAQKRHYEAFDEANKMMCSALMEIAKAIRDMGEKMSQSWRSPTLGFGRDSVSREHFEALVALGAPRIGHGGGSGSVRSQGIVISELAPQTLVTSTAMIVSAVERGDKGPVHVPQERHVEPSNMNTVGGWSREVVLLSHAGSGATAPRGLIMPPPDVPRLRIHDPAPQDATLGRARRMENVAMRVIHRWIFRLSSRSDGFARDESYVAVDYTTNLARAVWQSVEWSRVVSPSVVYHTLALRIDIPLWYVGAYIEDRLEDDDMAAHQESTILRLASSFHDALRGSQWSDNGKMSLSRLSRFGNAFRLLLATCMWIMCMGGDDVRSHEEALYYSQLEVKPMLMAAGSQPFS
ncbi:hypothetical protein CBR_g40469 [Chara braunii]|uniref:Uncharacterized protein n=1 Tax=Chara braunii TaxID=69332 RepID=A0A388LTZ3_CHABU|nr:hypothetical protein CBR_g40469 [Chara braunii]|eukprot:GBG85741.1 hypothetical protein CBR_g40469 [Chara braunii]